MNDLSKFFKPSVLELQPYSSARDEYDGSDGIFLDANENGFAFEYNRYPDPYQSELKKAISNWRNVDPEYIFLGNGSDEIIDLLIQSTCTSGIDRILSLDPSYGMYKVSSSINEIPLDLVALNADFTIDQEHLFSQLKEHHKLTFICSPNNPNGGIVDPEVLELILKKSKGLVIIDEAYIDFSRTESWVSKMGNYPNLIILQTFSKSLAAAGIRIGMAFMNPVLVSFLNKVKPPYNISSPSQAAALSRLQNLSDVKYAVKRIVEQREIVRQALSELSSVIHIFPSEANFLLIKFMDSGNVFEQLKSRKIIVRDRSRQRNCEGCLRITIGTEEQNNILLKRLKQIEAQLKSEI